MRSVVLLSASVLICVGLSASSKAAPRENVLFLAVDDMKDWVNCLGGYEGKVHTPNIDRLAGRGMLFTNAHCPSPKCAPSRAAIMTELRPSTTGLYGNDDALTVDFVVKFLKTYVRRTSLSVEQQQGISTDWQMKARGFLN